MPEEKRGWIGWGETKEFDKFRTWFKSQYGGMRSSFPFNLTNFKNSPYYLFWVEQGRPEQKLGPPSTEQERLEQLRSTATKEGTIPYKGNETWREYLEGRGWQLVETDVFGKLAPEKMFYQYKAVTPTTELSPEDAASLERTRRRNELELAKLEADLAERGKLSPWEQAQLEELQKARADEASKQRWQGQYQAAQQETLRLMNLLRSPSAEGDKQRMALDWENMKQLTLSNLLTNPNRNWIAIQQAQGQRNPYTPQPQTSDETFEQLRAQVKQADAAKKYADNLEKSYASDPTKSLNVNQQTMIDTAREAWRTSQERYLTAFEQRQVGAERARTGLAPLPPGPGTPEQEAAGYWATPRQTGVGGQFEVGEPGAMEEASPMPKIPGWLAQATGISGRIPRAGTKREIAPPSGQMWATLNPIQQAKYAGFVDWAGTKPFEELLHQTQVQLPRSPSLGGTRWTPARQVV